MTLLVYLVVFLMIDLSDIFGVFMMNKEGDVISMLFIHLLKVTLIEFTWILELF